MDSVRFDRLTTRLGTRLNRRQILAGGTASLAAVGISSHLHPLAALDATPIASPVAEEAHPAFLFVQLAESGSWIPKQDEEGVYLLTLRGTGEQTLYFSDRPDRIVGTVDTDQFLDALGFTPIEPPNAAIVVQTPEGERDVLVVELFNPIYTRTFGDDGDEFLTYEAKVLSAYQGEGLEEWVPQADDDQLPQEFSNVSLFIDDCADAAGCYAWIFTGVENFVEHTYVGAIPGGPYGRCYNWGHAICEPCSTTSSELDALCNSAFPDVCLGALTQNGTCFTNTCGYGGIC